MSHYPLIKLATNAEPNQSSTGTRILAIFYLSDTFSILSMYSLGTCDQKVDIWKLK